MNEFYKDLGCGCEYEVDPYDVEKDYVGPFYTKDYYGKKIKVGYVDDKTHEIEIITYGKAIPHDVLMDLVCFTDLYKVIIC